MRVYKVTHETRIYAINAATAEENLYDDNGTAPGEYFYSFEAARSRFEEIKSTLCAPERVGYKGTFPAYWFDGVLLTYSDDCDEPATEDGETLADAYRSGFCCYISDVEVLDN